MKIVQVEPGQATGHERPASGAEGNRTPNLRIANATFDLTPGKFYSAVTVLATVLMAIIVPTSSSPVNGETVALVTRRSGHHFTHPSHHAKSESKSYPSEAIPTHEAPPMQSALLSPSSPDTAPTLDALRLSLTRLYVNERTRKSAWRINHVLKQLQALGLAQIRDITREALSEWRVSVSHLAPRTQKGYYSAVCTVLNYALQSGWISRSPANVMPMRFSAQKIDKKRHLEWDELHALFSGLAAEATQGWKEHRLYALAVTLFSTGMRVSEAQRLRVKEIDVQRGLIDLRKRDLKTVKSSALVAMPESTCDVLAKWLPVCESEWAFPNAYGTGPWVSGAPGKKPLDRLQQAAERAGVGYVTFAMARHSLVTHGLGRFGFTAEEIAGQVRHAGVRTQGHYEHFDAENRRRVIARFVLPGVVPVAFADQQEMIRPPALATG